MKKLYEFPCGCKFDVIKELKGYKMPLLDFSYEKINWNCPAVWELAKTGRSLGIFQLESNIGRKYLKELEPESIEHFSALGALLRPGALGSLDDTGKNLCQKYCDRKQFREPVDIEFPALEHILKDTYGIMVFQENIIAISQEICGFSASKADDLRKCVSGDTNFISKTRGWIDIDTLLKTGYKNDEFLIMDENGNKSWKKIKDIWYVGQRTVKETRSSSGFYVKATRHHQFLTHNGWVARNTLNDKDYLVLPTSIEYDGKDIISKDLAFVMIGLIAEGYFVRDHTAHFTNFDSQMMEWWIAAFYNVFQIYPKLDKLHRVARLTKSQKEFINQWMIYGKSAVKEIPNVMMGMTKESTRSFLSFYLSCEGGMVGHNYCCSSKSKKLIYQIQLLLLRFGIIGNVAKKYNKKYKTYYYYLYIGRRENQLRLYWELTDYWPDTKINLLKECIEKKQVTSTNNNDIIPIEIINKIRRQYPSLLNYDSGHLFKYSGTRKKIKRLVIENTQDNQIINFLNDKKRYERYNPDGESRKEVKVYDFTMEDNSTPYIIANGLIIHNSVGKKDAAKLFGLEQSFVDGAEKVGKITRDNATKIFGWIKNASRYSFNRSHSTLYAIRSYVDFYLKSHFPLQFYTAKLKSPRKSTETEDIVNMIYEAKVIGIETRLPDIRDMRPVFYNDGKCIYFGLTDIKGYGESSFVKLSNVVQEDNSILHNFYEFAINSLFKLTESSTCSLIESGALDWTGITRALMLEEFKLLSSLTKGEKEKLGKYLQAQKSGVFDV